MSFEQCVVYVLFPLLGYLLGSIPFAWVIGKAHGVDIRTVGSKNIGATNLGRTLGKKYFWQAFFLDALKGFLPVFVVTFLDAYWNGQVFQKWYEQVVGNSQDTSAYAVLHQYLNHPVDSSKAPIFCPYWVPLLTGIACVLGHLFPMWLKFKGGKGVATGFGVVLGFWPIYTIAGIAAGTFFVVVLMLFRYISLASMTASLFFAVMVAIIGNTSFLGLPTHASWRDLGPMMAVACLFAAAIILRHRANIGRLLKGTEPQIGQKEVDKARLDKDHNP